jgi:hypothetical protein
MQVPATTILQARKSSTLRDAVVLTVSLLEPSTIHGVLLSNRTITLHY